MESSNVFAGALTRIYKYQYAGRLHVLTICGGVPSDPNVAEGWLKSKLGFSDEAALQKMVAETMVERGVTADEAVKIANTMKNLNGFKRESSDHPEHPGELYIEGRQLKSAIKEAANVAVGAGNLKQRGWGETKKWALGFIAEHVMVVENRLYLGVTEPSGINQRFVTTHRGTGIQYEEYVTDADIDFTIYSDHNFSADDWAAIWVTGGFQGLGASRSQGYGRYEVTRWEQVNK
jgi:hypothetical protein